MLDRVTAVGFDGLVLARSIGLEHIREYAISEALGQTPTVSRNRELAFWDLRQHYRGLRRRLGPGGIRDLARRTLADRSGDPKKLS